MAILYVARSARLGRWASDVGLGRHVYKVGVTEDDPKALAAIGWAGETDWAIVRTREIADLGEEQTIARLQHKEKMIDPKIYPRLKGALGVFRVNLVQVENHIVVSRALAGESTIKELKLKPADFAAYLIHNATR